MPNWCSNNLTIEHDDRSKVMEFVSAYKQGNVCDNYLPVPRNPDGSIYDGWYEWCVTNWGTKWDIGSDNNEAHGLNPTIVGNQASMTFDSAWSPPIGLYDKLVELGFKVDATYWEPGMAFCGIYTDGEDHYVEYTHHDMIPKRLWDEYNMEEFFDSTETV